MDRYDAEIQRSCVVGRPPFKKAHVFRKLHEIKCEYWVREISRQNESRVTIGLRYL